MLGVFITKAVLFKLTEILRLTIWMPAYNFKGTLIYKGVRLSLHENRIERKVYECQK